MKNQNLKILTILGMIVTMPLTKSPVFAQTNAAKPNMYESLVQRLAEKFKLNKNEVSKEVESFRTEQRTQRQAEMQKRYEANLDTLVKEGKITQDQKQKILQKHNEMMKNQPNFYNMTPEQKKAEKEKKRTEFEAWAEENNINIDYLHMKKDFGYGMHKGGYRLNK